MIALMKASTSHRPKPVPLVVTPFGGYAADDPILHELGAQVTEDEAYEMGVEIASCTNLIVENPEMPGPDGDVYFTFFHYMSEAAQAACARGYEENVKPEAHGAVLVERLG